LDESATNFELQAPPFSWKLQEALTNLQGSQCNGCEACQGRMEGHPGHAEADLSRDPPAAPAAARGPGDGLERGRRHKGRRGKGDGHAHRVGHLPPAGQKSSKEAELAAQVAAEVRSLVLEALKSDGLLHNSV
jgi:hypothetical protein